MSTIVPMNPVTTDLGLFREGEISLNTVRANLEALCVRYPANFSTYKIPINKPASCGNIVIVSVHDNILIDEYVCHS